MYTKYIIQSMTSSGIPFAELYRPTNFDDIVLDPLNKKILKNIIETSYFPNLLFYGPPGTGKTTTVVALAKIIAQAKLVFPNHSNTILIFCCNLRSVMDQASQWLFNANIPFAIGSVETDKN